MRHQCPLQRVSRGPTREPVDLSRHGGGARTDTADRPYKRQSNEIGTGPGLMCTAARHLKLAIVSEKQLQYCRIFSTLFWGCQDRTTPEPCLRLTILPTLCIRAAARPDNPGPVASDETSKMQRTRSEHRKLEDLMPPDRAR